MYILIREARADGNIDIEDGITVNVDGHTPIVGIEVLEASKRPSPSDLSRVPVQKLPLETTVP